MNLPAVPPRMVAVAHGGCAGCCACLRPELPIVPAAEVAPPSWVSPRDPGDFFQPVDYFIADVLQRNDWAPDARVEAARLFYATHGKQQLSRALEFVGDRIPPELRPVLDVVGREASSSSGQVAA